ncbi:MAG: alpha/beta hydrolase [Pseudomonadota bacterium]
MFVVTNRQVSNRKALGQFGKKPNAEGPNEIRLFDVSKEGRRWEVKALNDRLTKTQLRALVKKYHLPIDPEADRPWYASLKVACEVAEQARAEKKNILIFVHGFNNDVKDVMTAAKAIADLYNLIVLPFTWPANGGGPVSGTLSYREDKRDARASSGALDRLFMKAMEYLKMITDAQRDRLLREANKKHPDNREQADQLYARLLDAECPFTVNLLAHSMGNYLYKNLLKSTATEATRPLFDNVIMAAPDVNNLDHGWWLDRIQCRRRVYVCINENDYALNASRMKAGEEQLARLGHVTYNLTARRATYVDFTNAADVGNAHTYFKDDPTKDNPDVRAFFDQAFNGRFAENDLEYDSIKNVYRVP